MELERRRPSRLVRLAFLALIGLVVLTARPAFAATEELKVLRVSAANTAVETGVIDALAEAFREVHPGVQIRINSMGALAVIEHARHGHADIVITHHPQAEELFESDGFSVVRTLVMYNEFALFGPTSDPLRIAKERDLIKVLKTLARHQVPFMAPSVRSGTSLRLNHLWTMAGVEPGWVDYQVTESSAKSTLEGAALFGNYTFADMGTYLSTRTTLRGDLVPLYRDNVLLRNYYRAIVVNANRVPGVAQPLATAFHDFLISDAGQNLIRKHGEKRYGVQTFVPAAHLDDGLLARRARETLAERQNHFLTVVALAAVLAICFVVAMVFLRRSRQLEELRRASEQRFALAVAGSNDGIWDWNVQENAGFVSRRMLEILDLPAESDPNVNPWELLFGRLNERDNRSTRAWLEGFLASPRNGDDISAEYQIRRGEEIAWVLVRGRAQRDADGRVIRLSGSMTDVTERKRHAAEIEHQAMHDALTGLPNRNLLTDRLQQALRSAAQTRGSLAVIIMDLDRFKEINDTLGHHVGDLLLQQVCRRLERIVRPSDTVSRFGGDEFAILLPGADEVFAKHTAQKALLALNRLFELGSHQMYVGGSLGIALYPQHGDTVSSLLQHADVAMYHAKRNAGGCSIYNAEHDRNSVARLELEKDLREAIDGDALELHFQPKYDLKNNQMIGVEALLRWNHPQRGSISPAILIPIAEETGLIKPLTSWVINAAISQVSAWRRGGVDLHVAINLSVWNLQDPELVEHVRSALTTWEVPPACLEMEITESAMMADPERALAGLNSIADMGIHLTVDDYGTGFSSLAYLHKLPVDSLKIDKTFIMTLSDTPDNMTIVRSTIELAHNLGMSVVAEGVEREADLVHLRAMECDTAQGFFLSRPRPAAAITQLWHAQQGQSHGLPVPASTHRH